MNKEEHMTEAGGAHARAYAYLLGEMDEAEQFRFERDYLADEASYDAYLAAQDELIESYLADDLTPARRERFTRHFLTTEQRRERLRLIRDLNEHARSLSMSPSVPLPAKAANPAGSIRPLASRLRALLVWPSPRFGFAFRAAALAALAFACLVGWWARRDVSLEQASTPPPAQQPHSQPKDASPTATPDATPAPPFVAEQRPQPSPETSKTPQRRTVGARYALTLSPLTLRDGEGGGTHVLRLPRSRDGALNLRLLVEDAGNTGPLRVEVNTVEGVRVYVRGGLRVHRRRGVSSATLTLPTALLTDGDYTIRLKDTTSNGEATVVARYAFSIVRPVK